MDNPVDYVAVLSTPCHVWCFLSTKFVYFQPKVNTEHSPGMDRPAHYVSGPIVECTGPSQSGSHTHLLVQ